MQNPSPGNGTPDTFICHASEDKESIARPLKDALEQARVYAWLDESEMHLGDSIRRKIDQGLTACRSATVILSRTFFEKYWTQYEMDGIIQRQIRGEIALFPIRHAITIDEIRQHSPSLADIVSLNSSDLTINQIATKIAERLLHSTPVTAAHHTIPNPTAPSGMTEHAFGIFFVAPAGTPELPEDSNPKPTYFFGQEPEGWTSMVNNNSELEYIIDGQTLRIRLDWGNSWSGSEMQAAQLMQKGEPLAFTIRSSRGGQTYLKSAMSQDQANYSFTGNRNPSGWMTFSI